jgi:hypothetical protein
MNFAAAAGNVTLSRKRNAIQKTAAKVKKNPENEGESSLPGVAPTC